MQVISGISGFQVDFRWTSGGLQVISYVLQWTSWDSRLLQWTPHDFRGLQWTAWDFNGLQGDFRGLHGTPDDYNGLQMTPEDFSRLHGLHGIADEFSDIQLKSLVLPPPSVEASWRCAPMTVQSTCSATLLSLAPQPQSNPQRPIVSDW